ncbi:MAG: amidohydrolase family protein [Pseudomonadota bacterium]
MKGVLRILGRRVLAAASLTTLVGVSDALSSETSCVYEAGSERLLITATVLAPDGPIVGGRVLIGADGAISCVGAACGTGAEDVSRLDCGELVLSPGFINAHDHIDYAGIPPIPDSGERFAHRHEWRRGFNGRTRLETFGPDLNPLTIGWGELRFLVGGTTSIVGEAMAPGLTRNLDFADGLDGLEARPVTYDVFPLDDIEGPLLTNTCDYGRNPVTPKGVEDAGAYLAHLSEGVDDAAANEFRCSSSSSYDEEPRPEGGGVSSDWISPSATLIHAIALGTADFNLVAERGASIVWSPRSNLALYGGTLEVLEAKRRGVNIALGSDWLPSGSMNLNRELVCAQSYNTEELGGALTSRDLWEMVTVNAAKATHTDAMIGTIAVGRVADLALFRPAGSDPYDAAVMSDPRSTTLVLKGGQILFGDEALVSDIREDCEAISVAGAPKALCPEQGRPAASDFFEFAAQRDFYPLAFAGPPKDEPPCELANLIETKDTN